MDANDTDNRQKANQTPCAFCSIDCVLRDDEDVAGAAVDELIDNDRLGVFVTEAVGKVGVGACAGSLVLVQAAAIVITVRSAATV